MDEQQIFNIKLIRILAKLGEEANDPRVSISAALDEALASVKILVSDDRLTLRKALEEAIERELPGGGMAIPRERMRAEVARIMGEVLK